MMNEHKLVNGKSVPLSPEDVAQREADRLAEQAARAQHEAEEHLRHLRRKAIDAYLERALALAGQVPNPHPAIAAYLAAKGSAQ